jgi:hypothetical protein
MFDQHEMRVADNRHGVRPGGPAFLREAKRPARGGAEKKERKVMKRTQGIALCVVGACMLIAVGATAAGAALPELGRCVAVEGKVVGTKTIYNGNYKGKGCGPESPTKTGKYEFLPGPGAEPTFEGAGAGETVTLETVGGRKVFCGLGETKGEYTGAKTEKLTLVLNFCEDTTLKQSCQSLDPEEKEVQPIEGTIKSLPLKGELGFISGAGGNRPAIGWDIKPEVGSTVAIFECGPFLTGTQVTLDGSYIEQIKPTSKMTEEFHDKYKQVKGHQQPEQFEGGEKDTLTIKYSKGLETPITEQVGYKGVEEVTTEEELEYKTKP